MIRVLVPDRGNGQCHPGRCVCFRWRSQRIASKRARVVRSTPNPPDGGERPHYPWWVLAMASPSPHPRQIANGGPRCSKYGADRREHHQHHTIQHDKKAFSAVRLLYYYCLLLRLLHQESDALGTTKIATTVLLLMFTRQIPCKREKKKTRLDEMATPNSVCTTTIRGRDGSNIDKRERETTTYATSPQQEQRKKKKRTQCTQTNTQTYVCVVQHQPAVPAHKTQRQHLSSNRERAAKR